MRFLQQFLPLLCILFLLKIVSASEKQSLYYIKLSPGFSLTLTPGDNPCLVLARFCDKNSASSHEKCINSHQQTMLQEILKFSAYMPLLHIREDLFMKCGLTLPKHAAHHEFSSFYYELSAILHNITPGDVASLQLFNLKRTEEKLDVLEDIDLYGKALFYHPNSSFIISQLGLSLMKLGSHDLAYSLYENAVQRRIWSHVLQRPEWAFDPKVPAKPWHDTKDYPFVSTLEENYAIIRNELLENFKKSTIGFSNEITNIPSVDTDTWKMLYLKHSNSKNYTSYALDFYPNSTEVLRNCKKDFIEVKFSRILPGTHIRPHTGPTNDRLRGHLTLVHSGGAKIRVGREWRTWEEGKVLIFDSSWEHEVYHGGHDPRVILIFDIWNKI